MNACTRGALLFGLFANDDVAPLGANTRLGEYATDVKIVYTAELICAKFGHMKHFRKTSPFTMYLSTPSIGTNVDSTTPWSIIYGANVAYWIQTKRFSRWVQPDTLLCIFSLGDDGIRKKCLNHAIVLRSYARALLFISLIMGKQ